jgi:uncharacterized protein HemX
VDPAAPSTRTSPRSAAHSTGGGDRQGEPRRRHQGPAAPVTSAPTPGPPGTASGTRVSGDLPDTASQNAGSSRPALLGAGVLVVLGLGAGLTAWRRSQRP